MKIWHYSYPQTWEYQTIELNPDPTFDEILKGMSVSGEPALILGDTNNFMAIFKHSEGFVISIEIQEISEIVVVQDFPSLIEFINMLNSTFLGIAKLMELFSDED